MNLRLAALAAGLAIGGASIDLQAAESGYVLRQDFELLKPDAPRPQFPAEFGVLASDGHVEKRIVVECPGFQLIFQNLPSWIPTVYREPRFSHSLTAARDHDITFRVARYLKKDFISSLDSDEWNRYLAYLKWKCPDYEITFQHDSRIKSRPPFVLNCDTRQIEYERRSETGETYKTREIFAFLGKELYVFSFDGPLSKIDELRDAHNLFLTRMNVRLKKDS